MSADLSSAPVAAAAELDSAVNPTDVRSFLLGLQWRITSAISALDGQAFTADAWQKEPGEALQGNGLTQILENGAVFERVVAAVDVPHSVVGLFFRDTAQHEIPRLSQIELSAA